MANRSYIYALNGDKHISLGEYPNAIPYAYRILAAYENDVVESHLYDKIVGITANFNKGRSVLFYFLDYLLETGEMDDVVAFKENVDLTKKFLNNITAEHTLLENGEVYALFRNEDGDYLNGAEMEKVNTYKREDYQWIGEDIDHLKELKIQPHQFFHLTDESLLKLFGWVYELRTSWKESFGLDSWRSVLYYQFSEQN